MVLVEDLKVVTMSSQEFPVLEHLVSTGLIMS
jgi:hypothetical protein